ncbi:MAG: response regulator [Chitinophagales bacterium]|nr:response regulator [Chitinophagales bacterium]
MVQKRILICDDDIDIGLVTKIILEAKGYKVEISPYCKDIIALVSETKPDLVLMDLRIPEVGGEEYTRILKTTDLTKDLPVILFSANNDVQKIAERVGANDYIAKPFDIDRLVKVIETHIN